MEPLVQPEYPTAEMLDRYLSGRASPEEVVVVRVYLSRHPDAERVLKRLPILALDQSGDATPDVQGWWESFVARAAIEGAQMDATDRSVQERSRVISDTQGFVTPRAYRPATMHTTMRTRLHIARWAIAGLVLFGVMIGGTAYLRLNVAQRNLSSSPQSFAQTIVTKAGQHRTYRFPDGSAAMLAPNTTLQYTTNPDHKVREVVIDGEALFTVVPDDSRPFIVKAATATIRVLGTTFTVRRYASDTTTTVVVAQGKVGIASDVLAGGESARIGSNNQIQIDRSVDIGNALAWTTGKLTFKNAPLHAVIAEFQRWYDIKITVANPKLFNRTITMTFLTDSPEKAVDGLATILRANVSRDGNHVILTPNE